MGSLLGSSGTDSSSSSSGWTQSQGSSWQNSNSFSGIADWTKGGLQNAMARAQGMMGDSAKYSKEAAIADVQGVLKNQAANALQSVMPSIAKQQTTAGAYNSTAKDLLQNDANARIMSQLADTTLNAIKTYGDLGQNADRLALGAITDIAKTTTTSTSSSSGGSQQSSQGKQTSSGSSSGGGSGLLGLFADGGRVPYGKVQFRKAPISDFLTGALNKFKGVDGSGPGPVIDPNLMGPPDDATTNPNLLEKLSMKGDPVGDLFGIGDAAAEINGITKLASGVFDSLFGGGKDGGGSDGGGVLDAIKGYSGFDKAAQEFDKLTALNPESMLADVTDSITNPITDALALFGFADGGQVPQNRVQEMFPNNIFARTRARQLAESGLLDEPQAQPQQDSGGNSGITINVNSPQQQPKPQQQGESLRDKIRNIVGFEDGGQVPQNELQRMFPNNVFARTRARQMEEAGLTDQSQGQGQSNGNGGGVTINVNSQQQPAQQPAKQRSGESLRDKIRSIVGFEDGGQVDTRKLMEHMAQNKPVRHVEDDAEAGGKIRGPQSKSGKDNQLIAVAGGEGILPTDVMEVPGVPELVQNLIKTYHKY